MDDLYLQKLIAALSVPSFREGGRDGSFMPTQPNAKPPIFRQDKNGFLIFGLTGDRKEGVDFYARPKVTPDGIDLFDTYGLQYRRAF